MAKTIANFLVGVGLDTKDFDKGARGVDTALSGFRSKAQLAGGALAAAFSAVGVAAIKSGSEADAFMRKVEKFSTAPRFIYNLGNAFQRMGGQAGDAISTIEKTEGILDALRKGDASALEAAGLAQVDVSQLQTSRTGEELLANLADVLARTPDNEHGEFQRRSLAETFGLTDEGLKLLRQGRAELYGAISDVDRIAENLQAAADAGREYQKAMADVNLEFKRIGNSLAKDVLPHFSSLLNDFAGFLANNMPKVEKAIDYTAENPGKTALVTGGAALWASLSTGAAIASKLGMKASAGALRTGGRAGLYGAGLGAASGLYDYLTEDDERKGPDASELRKKMDSNPNALIDYIKSGKINNPQKENKPVLVGAESPKIDADSKYPTKTEPAKNEIVLTKEYEKETIHKASPEKNRQLKDESYKDKPLVIDYKKDESYKDKDISVAGDRGATYIDKPVVRDYSIDSVYRGLEKTKDNEKDVGYEDGKGFKEYSQESIPNTWWRNGVADQNEAAAISPLAQAARGNHQKSLLEDLRTSNSVPPPIVIENKLMLNEREIAKTIRKVNAEDNYNAYTEVVTTESR